MRFPRSVGMTAALPPVPTDLVLTPLASARRLHMPPAATTAAAPLRARGSPKHTRRRPGATGGRP